MKRHKPTTLPLGTISEGTLRPEDLIPAYLDALDGIRLTKAERATVRTVRARYEKAEQSDTQDGESTSYYADENSSFDIDDLTQILDSHCPDYTYFGSLEGDGACFGVWASIESLEEDSRFGDNGVVKIDAGDAFPVYSRDTKEHPSQKANYVMSVTDHGNVTLYRRAGNRWIEVWSVV